MRRRIVATFGGWWVVVIAVYIWHGSMGGKLFWAGLGGRIGRVLYCAVFEGGWGLGCGRVFGFDYQRLGASAVLDKARIFQ